ncbi:hypothetical protein D1007_50184 [Hordeum vulgare]|nr:hypothetical protein D1007_50184 [Hordeum vulgare]
MVYEDESSNNYSSLLYISSSSDGMQYQVPASIEDQEYMVVETTPQVPCEHHGLAAERHVAVKDLTRTGGENKLDATYDKLVEYVHRPFNAQEDRMMDFSYLDAKMKVDEVTNSVDSDMKTEMEKKDAKIFKMQEKYKVLMILSQAQGTVIENLKLKHLKEKQQLNEASRNLQLQVDELNKS